MTAPASSLWPRWADTLHLIRWDRPAGTYLLLWPTLTALWAAADGFPGWHLLTVFVLGSFLMRSAGCAVNDVADQGFDRHVQRTAQRPVTTGRVSTAQALRVAALLSLMAFALVLSTDALTIAWSLGALAITVLYPFTKRWVSMPQAVLGLAFSMGIPMAFSAVQGHVPLWAWGLVLANACWVLAYDTQYAMVDREDDLRIGIRTSAITLGRWDIPAIALFYAAYWGLSQVLLGRPHPAWWWAWGAAAAQLVLHLFWIRHRDREGCFRAFTANHWVGFTLWLGVVFSR